MFWLSIWSWLCLDQRCTFLRIKSFFCFTEFFSGKCHFLGYFEVIDSFFPYIPEFQILYHSDYSGMSHSCNMIHWENFHLIRFWVIGILIADWRGHNHPPPQNGLLLLVQDYDSKSPMWNVAWWKTKLSKFVPMNRL